MQGSVEGKAISAPSGQEEKKEEEYDQEELGERAPRIARRPDKPTKAMIDEHEPLHVHYRSWCPHCQAGRSVSKKHLRRPEGEEAVGPTVSLDYAFKYDDETEEATKQDLVAVDRISGAIWALEVDGKGVDTGASVKWLDEKLNMAGYSGVKVTIRSDQWPAILALKNVLAQLRKAETASIESPVRESKSNGLVERAIRNWRDQYRTLRHFLEYRMNAKMADNSSLSTWLVTWAADVINKFCIQPSGRTAFELMTNHKCRHLIVGFGEKVYFQHSKTLKNEYRKGVGVFLGVNDRCNTYLVATDNGVFASPHIVRMPNEDAYDVELLRAVDVRYYDYIDNGVKAPPAIVASRSVRTIPNPETAPIPSAGGGYAPRRFRISKADLEAHGYTAGCPGCISAQADDGIRRGGHTEACCTNARCKQ